MNIAHHAGFSLLELMIALALGTIVVLAAGELLITININTLMYSDRSKIQTNAHMTTAYLTHELQKSGLDNRTNTTYALTSSVIINDTAFVNTNSNIGTGDQLAIAWIPYNPDDRLCSVNIVNVGVLTYSRFWVEESDGGRRSLHCQSGYETIKNNKQQVLHSVYAMHILYGISEDGSSITNYKNADHVSDWTKVTAIKLALLLDGAMDGKTSNAILSKKNRQYRLLDSELYSFTDKQIRQLVTTTIYLPNAPY